MPYREYIQYIRRLLQGEKQQPPSPRTRKSLTPIHRDAAGLSELSRTALLSIFDDPFPLRKGDSSDKNDDYECTRRNVWPPLFFQPRLLWWVDDHLWNCNLCMADEIPFPPTAPGRKRKRRHCSFIEDEAGADNEHDDDDDEGRRTLVD